MFCVLSLSFLLLSFFSTLTYYLRFRSETDRLVCRSQTITSGLGPQAAVLPTRETSGSGSPHRSTTRSYPISDILPALPLYSLSHALTLSASLPRSATQPGGQLQSSCFGPSLQHYSFPHIHGHLLDLVRSLLLDLGIIRSWLEDISRFSLQ